jgi:hypothetical protein
MDPRPRQEVTFNHKPPAIAATVVSCIAAKFSFEQSVIKACEMMADRPINLKIERRTISREVVGMEVGRPCRQ